jgi:hypothetical protein
LFNSKKEHYFKTTLGVNVVISKIYSPKNLRKVDVFVISGDDFFFAKLGSFLPKLCRHNSPKVVIVTLAPCIAWIGRFQFEMNALVCEKCSQLCSIKHGFEKCFWSFISHFKSHKQCTLSKLTQLLSFPKNSYTQHYTLEGFEPSCSVPQADAVTTAPRRRPGQL